MTIPRKQQKSVPREPRYSIRDISEKMNIPIPTLHNWLREPEAPQPIAVDTAHNVGRMSLGGLSRLFYRLHEVQTFIATHHGDYVPHHNMRGKKKQQNTPT